MDSERIENVRKLEALFADHPELKKAFQNDATVHAWFRQYEYGRCTLEEVFIGVIVNLKKEKQHFFDKVVELTQLSVYPKTFLIKKHKREKFKDGDRVEVEEIKPPFFDMDGSK